MSTARPTINLSADEAASERRSMFLWTGVIVGLLGIHITMCMLAVFAIAGDDSLAIEPSYHQQALDWDASRQALRDSAALGWKAELNVNDTPDSLGRRAIQLVVTDEQGQPISGAQAKALVFHHAHANKTAELELAEAGEGTGVYTTTQLMPQAGLWELRFTVKKGEDVFLNSEVLDLK